MQIMRMRQPLMMMIVDTECASREREHTTSCHESAGEMDPTRSESSS